MCSFGFISICCNSPRYIGKIVQRNMILSPMARGHAHAFATALVFRAPRPTPSTSLDRGKIIAWSTILQCFRRYKTILLLHIYNWVVIFHSYTTFNHKHFPREWDPHVRPIRGSHTYVRVLSLNVGGTYLYSS